MVDRPAGGSGQADVDSAGSGEGPRRLGFGRQTFHKAADMGVRIGFGTDAGVYPHGIKATEFELMVEHGMKQFAVLSADISANAELLGLAGRTEALEPGKFADIMAVTCE